MTGDIVITAVSRRPIFYSIQKHGFFRSAADPIKQDAEVRQDKERGTIRVEDLGLIGVSPPGGIH